jgi:hypothetical protein
MLKKADAVISRLRDGRPINLPDALAAIELRPIETARIESTTSRCVRVLLSPR